MYKDYMRKLLHVVTAYLPSSFRMLVCAVPISVASEDPARTNFFLAHPRARGEGASGTHERWIKRWKGGGVI